MLALLTAGALLASAAAPPDAGAVVFLGDSITWQNLYVSYVETHLRRTFPQHPLRILNRGVRGDTAPDVLARLERDVPEGAALVFVMLGINDGGFAPPSGIRREQYLRNMERLVTALRARSAQVVLLTPTAVDPIDDAHRAYNAMLALMSEGLVAAAHRLGVQVIDVHSRFVAAMKGGGLMLDDLHPGPAGHAVIAEAIVELWPLSVERQTVALAACDQAAGSAFELRHDHRNVRIPGSDFAPSRHYLVVTDASCELELLVEGRVQGRFAGELLRRGIDLDELLAAPWTAEAYRTHALVLERWRWSYASWDPRGVGAAEAYRMVGGTWSGTDAELRQSAQRELARLGRELQTGRRGKVIYAARLRPVPR